MVTIAQLDPITVTFSMPEAELSYVTQAYQKGDAPVFIQLPGKEEMQGKLIFIDNTTDAQTGTVKMKAQFENKERGLWPGAFVNVRMSSRTLPEVTVVSTPAVVTGPKE